MADTTPTHKHPSQADIDVAVMRERLRASDKRDEAMMAMQHQILAELSQVRVSLAVGAEKFENLEGVQNDTTQALAAITQRVDSIEADKRANAGIIASILAFLTAAGSYFK